MVAFSLSLWYTICLILSLYNFFVSFIHSPNVWQHARMFTDLQTKGSLNTFQLGPESQYPRGGSSSIEQHRKKEVQTRKLVLQISTTVPSNSKSVNSPASLFPTKWSNAHNTRLSSGKWMLHLCLISLWYLFWVQEQSFLRR